MLASIVALTVGGIIGAGFGLTRTRRGGGMSAFKIPAN